MAKRAKREKISPPKGAVVIYARLSTMHQKEVSIDAQVSACRKYADDNQLTVIREYKDRASGTNIEGREELRELCNDSKKGEFSKVLVFSLDRFSRNVRDYLNLTHELKENGVSLYSLQEHVEDSQTGKTLAIVLMLNAEMYVNSVKMHEQKTLRELAEQGKYLGGALPLGYLLNENKEYVINEEKAHIVRKIFQDYASGKSQTDIINHLNRLGYRTEAGRKFGKHSLYGILKNEKYIGTYIWEEDTDDDTEMAKPFRAEIKNHFTGIVDEDLFNKVQAKLKENKEVAGQSKAQRNYVLSGLVYCGHCNTKMHVNTRRGKFPYSSYGCPKAKKKECGNNKSVRRRYVERYVLGKIFHYLFAPNSLEEITSDLNEYIRSQSNVSMKEIKNVKTNLGRLNNRIQNLNDSIMDGNKSPSTEKELKELEEEQVIITNELERLRKQNEVEQLDKDDVFWDIIRKVKSTLRDDSEPECREFMKAYVTKIVVFEDSIKVHFNLPGWPDKREEGPKAKQKNNRN